MACCQHRPEPGCLLVPCTRIVDGLQRKCLCASEVRSEIELDTEVGQARVPDSAREAS